MKTLNKGTQTIRFGFFGFYSMSAKKSNGRSKLIVWTVRSWWSLNKVETFNTSSSSIPEAMWRMESTSKGNMLKAVNAWLQNWSTKQNRRMLLANVG